MAIVIIEVFWVDTVAMLWTLYSMGCPCGTRFDEMNNYAGIFKRLKIMWTSTEAFTMNWKFLIMCISVKPIGKPHTDPHHEVSTQRISCTVFECAHCFCSNFNGFPSQISSEYPIVIYDHLANNKWSAFLWHLSRSPFRMESFVIVEILIFCLIVCVE